MAGEASQGKTAGCRGPRADVGPGRDRGVHRRGRGGAGRAAGPDGRRVESGRGPAPDEELAERLAAQRQALEQGLEERVRGRAAASPGPAARGDPGAVRPGWTRWPSGWSGWTEGRRAPPRSPRSRQPDATTAVPDARAQLALRGAAARRGRLPPGGGARRRHAQGPGPPVRRAGRGRSVQTDPDQALIDSVLAKRAPELGLTLRTQVGRAIAEEARRAGYDPLLILAVIDVESEFDEERGQLARRPRADADPARRRSTGSPRRRGSASPGRRSRPTRRSACAWASATCARSRTGSAGTSSWR